MNRENLETIDHVLFRCAINALLKSHPNPEALWDAWREQMGMLWENMLDVRIRKIPVDQQQEMTEAQAAYQVAQAQWEKHFPPKPKKTGP